MSEERIKTEHSLEADELTPAELDQVDGGGLTLSAVNGEAPMKRANEQQNKMVITLPGTIQS